MSGPIVTRTSHAGNVTLFTREVTSWEDVLAELAHFGRGWIFRGQRRDWSLKCTLNRLRGDWDLLSAERQGLEQLQRRAHLFLPAPAIPDQNEWLEWVALLQHHGGPTRLLDFSHSPYVAAFNALEELEHTESGPSRCVMWAFNQAELAERAILAMRKVFRRGRLEHYLSKDPLTKPVEITLQEGGGGAPFVAPVTPFYLNARMVAQQGLFLCLGKPDLDVLGNFERDGAGETAPTQAVKIVFPRDNRPAMLAALREMNIGRDTLFPGLDGLAQSLWQTLLPDKNRFQAALLLQLARPANWPDAPPETKSDG